LAGVIVIFLFIRTMLVFIDHLPSSLPRLFLH